MATSRRSPEEQHLCSPQLLPFPSWKEIIVQKQGRQPHFPLQSVDTSHLLQHPAGIWDLTNPKINIKAKECFISTEENLIQQRRDAESIGLSV